MLNPFEGVTLPPDPEELIRRELRRLRDVQGVTVKDREIRRLIHFRDALQTYNRFLNSFPKLDRLHPFYLTSLEITAGSLDKVKRCLAQVRRKVNVASRLLENYVEQIKRSPEARANILMRTGFGRAASVLRDGRECITWLAEVTRELSKAKSVDPDLPTIIIAGPPNVGKSTLVSKISSAKPRIASFPFTTKEVHVGHMNCGVKIQVLDTPGILDRPDSERNVIERKAVNAIRNLRGIVIFMFDVSNSSLYDAGEQLSIYREVTGMGRPVVTVFNKVDDVNQELFDALAQKLNQERVLKLSAEKGEGMVELKREIFIRLKEISPDISDLLDC